MTTTEVKRFIWEYFKSHTTWNEYGIAGLMGNMQAESAFIVNNMQDAYQNRLGLNDATYTAGVDNGTYANFVRDSVGYGLCQWTHWSRKQKLLDFAQQQGTGIGNLETQCAFCIKEINDSYPLVLTVLKTALSVREASNRVLWSYEQPANQGTGVQNARAGYGEAIYKEFHNAEEAKVSDPKTEILTKIDKIIAELQDLRKEMST